MLGSRQSFIPSSTFSGKKVGYFFRNGDKGIGYYLDGRQEQDLAKVSLTIKMQCFSLFLCKHFTFGQEEKAQKESLERKRKFNSLVTHEDEGKVVS
jgi:hypothetical protein